MLRYKFHFLLCKSNIEIGGHAGRNPVVVPLIMYIFKQFVYGSFNYCAFVFHDLLLSPRVHQVHQDLKVEEDPKEMW